VAMCKGAAALDRCVGDKMSIRLPLGSNGASRTEDDTTVLCLSVVNLSPRMCGCKRHFMQERTFI
jgi:hypothetical protein